MADNGKGGVGQTQGKAKQTGMFERQGQTAGAYGNDPAVGDRNGAGNRSKDLIP